MRERGCGTREVAQPFRLNGGEEFSYLSRVCD